jgi:hypothetical protein
LRLSVRVTQSHPECGSVGDEQLPKNLDLPVFDMRSELT